MDNPRTFKITSPHMKGDDIKSWQREIRSEFARMDIKCPIEETGIYDVATRAFTASLAHAVGMSASKEMENGVTPNLRSRIRNRDLTIAEQREYADRQDWRRKLRRRYASASIVEVHRPVTKIIEDSWGYHPPVHDGLDVICPANSTIFAMVESKVIDVRSGGWWGKAPSGDVTKGDGIIQLEVLKNIGPFKRGYHIGYGHAEHARVKVGETVKAGDPLGKAGLAVAWHVHLMYNDGSTMKGIGNLDPRAILDYSVKHG